MLLGLFLGPVASLHRHKTSPYWYCSYRKPDGTWALRSTKQKNHKKAEETCWLWEKAARDADRGKLTEHAARRVINEIYAMAHEDQLVSASVKEYFEDWITRKKVETADGTVRKYQDVTTQFLGFLGDRQHQDIARITRHEVAKFRDTIIARLSAGSTNIAVKILRVAFAQARRDGYLTENPAEDVAIVKQKEELVERRAFTLKELKSLLEVAADEWRGMILFGLYTGQRLKDLAMLTWQNLDLQSDELRITTSKTGRRQILPLAKPLKKYLMSLTASDDPKQPVFPKIFESISKTGRSGHLSNQFYDIMYAAGLAKERKHVKTGQGRSTKRTTSELSFHCLRHTATSLLKNAGVSDAVAREFIGHDSPAISANYTHIETSALKKAADSMPDIWN